MIRSIYEGEIIGDPVYTGLSYGGVEVFNATDDFSKADHPGLRAIRIGPAGEFILASELTDPYEISVTSGGLSNGQPIGMITPYGGSSAPDGWLICDGSAVSRTTYADLFDAIGTTFGSGDGSTTFNLPDLRQRFPAGAQASTSFDPGETGGASTHDHALSSLGWAKILISALGGANGVYMRRIATTPYTQTLKYIGNNAGIGTTVDTTQTGVGAELGGATDSASNLPPYLATNFLILAGTGAPPVAVELWY